MEPIYFMCLLLLLSSITHAHMQMSYPFPIRSPLNPQNSYTEVDYSYTSPLNADGSNFPCKGYQNDRPIRTTATFQTGQQYNMSIVGGAQHDGGSCQLSLSYDNGATFKVIKSIIGGCPITLSYDFIIPDFAPSGTALFAWTWFNLVGNREMYMDCAEVQIAGSTPGRHRRAEFKRQQSMSSLPDIFVANVNQPSQCATFEGQDVIFPNPGNDVIHGSDSITPQSGQGYSCRGTIPSAVSGGQSIAASGLSTSSRRSSTSSSTLDVIVSLISRTLASYPTQSALTSSTATIAQYSKSTTSVVITATTSHVVSVTILAQSTGQSSIPTQPTSSQIPAPTLVAGGCTPNSIMCNTPSTFSTCNSQGTGYTPMGSVAAGTTCQNGRIIMQNSGACTPDGSIKCGPTGRTWMLCSQGGLINMGPTAPGVVCRDGEMVAG